MEGIFVYADEALRKALRARAYRSGRSMSDVGRDALFAAMTVPIGPVQRDDVAEVVARHTLRAETNAPTEYVLGRWGGQWFFAWRKGGSIERIWAPDVAEAASLPDEGAEWAATLANAREAATACLDALCPRPDDSELKELEATFQVNLEPVELTVRNPWSGVLAGIDLREQCTAERLASLAELMDDDIRERVHRELAPCSPARFFARYAELVGPETAGVIWFS